MLEEKTVDPLSIVEPFINEILVSITKLVPVIPIEVEDPITAESGLTLEIVGSASYNSKIELLVTLDASDTCNVKA